MCVIDANKEGIDRKMWKLEVGEVFEVQYFDASAKDAPMPPSVQQCALRAGGIRDRQITLLSYGGRNCRSCGDGAYRAG